MSAIPPGATTSSGQTWQDLGGAASGFSTAVGDLFGGIERQQAFENQAAIYGEEAQYLQLGQQEQENVDFLKYTAEQRRASTEVAADQAAAAGNGLKESGTVLDLIRETVQNANFEQGQTAVAATANYTNFQGQINAATMEAEAASKAGQSAFLGGIFGAVGGIAKGAFALAPLL